MTDVSEISNQTFDDVPDSFNLPNGDYVFRVQKAKLEVTKNENKTPLFALRLVPVAVIEAEGVSDDDLVNAYPVQGSLWLSDKAKKITRDQIEACFGIEVEQGMSYAMIAEEMIGREVRAVTELKVRGEGENAREEAQIKRFLRPKKEKN